MLHLSLQWFNAGLHILWEAFNRVPEFLDRNYLQFYVEESTLVMEIERGGARLVYKLPFGANAPITFTGGTLDFKKLWGKLKEFTGDSVVIEEKELIDRDRLTRFTAGVAETVHYLDLPFARKRLTVPEKGQISLTYETQALISTFRFLQLGRCAPSEFKKMFRGAVIGSDFWAAATSHRIYVEHDTHQLDTGKERLVLSPVIDGLVRASEMLHLPPQLTLTFSGGTFGTKLDLGYGASLELYSEYNATEDFIYGLKERWPGSCCNPVPKKGLLLTCRYAPTDAIFDGAELRKALSEVLKHQKSVMPDGHDQRRAHVRLICEESRAYLDTLDTTDQVISRFEVPVQRTTEGGVLPVPFYLQLNTYYFMEAIQYKRVQVFLRHVHPFVDTDPVVINDPDSHRFVMVAAAPMDGRMAERKLWEVEQGGKG